MLTPHGIAIGKVMLEYYSHKLKAAQIRAHAYNFVIKSVISMYIGNFILRDIF